MQVFFVCAETGHAVPDNADDKRASNFPQIVLGALLLPVLFHLQDRLDHDNELLQLPALAVADTGVLSDLAFREAAALRRADEGHRNLQPGPVRRFGPDKKEETRAKLKRQRNRTG